MSSNQSSYTSYSSTSYTSSSSTNGGQPHVQSYTERANYNSQDGGFVERESRETGQPTLTERRELPVQGQLSSGSNGSGANRRIEDVTESEADQLYRERMEDEYATREGGA